MSGAGDGARTAGAAGAAAEARAALVAAGHRLMAEGLVARSWGNLSLRLDDRTMAITPSGIPYADLREDMIVLVELESGEWQGTWKPSGERGLHRAIYLSRPEVGAIVHTHQNAASACAASRLGFQAPWGEVPCAAYALPSTKALAKATVAALDDRAAVLLANHGVFAVGASMDQAFDRARELESAAAAFIAARAGESLPAPADAAWDIRDLRPTALGDGSPALMSAAPYTLAWSERASPLPAALDDLAQLVGTRVPATKSLPTRRPRAEAVFVQGRGLLICGAEAEAIAMVVEKAARAAICGEAMGGAKRISVLEALLMRQVYKLSYAKQAEKATAS